MTRLKFRNWVAVVAHFRKGGPMKHKNAPKGGARNQSRDLKDQNVEELRSERRSDSDHQQSRKK